MVKHGRDFNYVCGLAGRDPNYVRKKMLNKVIDREAMLVDKHHRVKNYVNNVLILKEEIKKIKPRIKNDYKNLPKYTHDYVDR